MSKVAAKQRKSTVGAALRMARAELLQLYNFLHGKSLSFFLYMLYDSR